MFKDFFLDVAVGGVKWFETLYFSPYLAWRGINRLVSSGPNIYMIILNVIFQIVIVENKLQVLF